MTESTKAAAVSAETVGTTLTLTFANGETLRIDAADVHQEIRDAAMMHGLKQKLVDAAAIARNTETGRSATVADKFEAVRDVHARLLAGSWNKPRDAGAGESGGLLFRALLRVFPSKTPASIRDYLAGLTKEQQAALRKTGRVASAIEELRATSASTGGINGEDLLAGLE